MTAFINQNILDPPYGCKKSESERENGPRLLLSKRASPSVSLSNRIENLNLHMHYLVSTLPAVRLPGRSALGNDIICYKLCYADSYATNHRLL